MARGPSKGAPAPSSRPAVLLVDDEPMLLDALSRHLEGVFRLHTAADAVKADAILAAHPVDVIVCDHVLPGEQGLDFLERSKAAYPAAKRILVTGYSNPDFIARGIETAGLSACLLKPARASEIAGAVRAALVGWSPSGPGPAGKGRSSSTSSS